MTNIKLCEPCKKGETYVPRHKMIVFFDGRMNDEATVSRWAIWFLAFKTLENSREFLGGHHEHTKRVRGLIDVDCSLQAHQQVSEEYVNAARERFNDFLKSRKNK